MVLPNRIPAESTHARVSAKDYRHLINHANGFCLVRRKRFPLKQVRGGPIAPNLRTNRVVPPAPGKRPTRISKPDFCLWIICGKDAVRGHGEFQTDPHCRLVERPPQVYRPFWF